MTLQELVHLSHAVRARLCVSGLPFAVCVCARARALVGCRTLAGALRLRLVLPSFGAVPLAAILKRCCFFPVC